MDDFSLKDKAVVGTVSISDNGLKLDGEFVYATASSLLADGCAYIKSHASDSIFIDLNNVDKIDSAGITVLLAWKRLSDDNTKKFHIVNAQEQAISLITTNKLDGLLNLQK